MSYEGHTMDINPKQFDEQCNIIEEYRKTRDNVFIFCNNGYQRSIPFLTYYLCHHHADEIHSIEVAVDTILAQVDKKNYAKIRDTYVQSMHDLFKHHSLFVPPKKEYYIKS
jgi:hypothetical protein